MNLEIGNKIAKGGEWLEKGLHNIPKEKAGDWKTKIPVRHRLYNALGMAAGFSSVKYFTDILYGYKINGGQYEAVKKESVPLLLRPLYGRIKNNPFSDDLSAEKKTIIQKLLPSLGGAAGAVGGSWFFFRDGDTAGKVKELAKKKAGGEILTAAQDASIKAYKQGFKWRIATGLTAWFASVTTLTGQLYGSCLNQSFRLVNNAKAMVGNPNSAPVKDLKWANRLAIGEITATVGLVTFLGRKFVKKRNAAHVDLNADLSQVSAETYVNYTERMNMKNKGKGSMTAFAGWVGDAALAVPPVHRLWSAVGLSTGGALGLYVAKNLKGQSLANGVNEPIQASKLFKSLHLEGVLAAKDTNSDLKNRLLSIGAKSVFATFMAAGTMIGSKRAYKTSYQKFANPKSIEDFERRTKQHYGDSFIPLIGLTSIYGSAALTYLVPPISYGNMLWPRVIMEQGRSDVLPGMQGLSGSSTTSYMGMGEALQYLRHYAVKNPAQRTERFEYLAYTIMGPMAKASGVNLTGANIKQFVDKLNAVRDEYWQEGGVPKDKQAALDEKLVQEFTGKGLDKTLYECGVDSLKIKFNSTNGYIGAFARTVSPAARKKVDEDEKACREMIEGWRKEWTVAPEKTETVSAIPNDKTPPLFNDVIKGAQFTPEESARLEAAENALSKNDSSYAEKVGHKPSVADIAARTPSASTLDNIMAKNAEPALAGAQR